MADKKRIALIVEGAKREVNYWKSLAPIFFPKTEFEILPLSLGENLFMLYAQLKRDDDLDVIEVVRERSPEAEQALLGKTNEDFQEIYLLMDFDPQAYEYKNNPPVVREQPPCETVRQMLDFFDNETEQGRLYVSYPMCEALRDVREGECLSFYRCHVPYSEICNYKNCSGKSAFSDHTRYDKYTWQMFLAIFLRRCNCLLKKETEPEKLLDWYKKENISPTEIFREERELFEQKDEVFVLSAFSEFLLDYFKPEFWKDLAPETIRKGCT